MKKIISFCSAVLFVSAALAHDAVFITAAPTLPPPPATDSQAVREDLLVLHQIQETRTTAQIAQAQADEKLRTMFVYHDVLGGNFNPEALPLTATFAQRVKKNAAVATAPLKKIFHRIRPYQLDATLTPVCKITSAHNSYPSEHSTVGYLNALILIDMVPEKRTALLARADAYAHNRLVCGVHFPGDVEAGRQLALGLHAAMNADPQFMQARAMAQAELRKALGLPQQASDN